MSIEGHQMKVLSDSLLIV